MAIGNETDMLHAINVDYLVSLLTEMSEAGIDNPISLITKAPLSSSVLEGIRAIPALQVIFFLSYSGLGQRFEPNFTDKQLRTNFVLAKAHGFPVIHYWRPLLPDNINLATIREMLSFTSATADATVFTGLKLHPELTRVISRDGSVSIPTTLINQYGEWLESETVKLIYREAQQICPNYPLYRHTSCALACVLSQPNHTGTVFREDICPPSHCPTVQRQICQIAHCIPSREKIIQTLSALRRPIDFNRFPELVVVKGEVSQEEFSFLVHNLKCPLRVDTVKMQNLYHGSIYEGQRKVG